MSGRSLVQPGHHAAHESDIANVPQVQVAHQRGHAPAPGIGQIRQFYGDSIDTHRRRINHAVNADEEPRRKKSVGDELRRDPQACDSRHAKHDPRSAGGENAEIHQPHPDRGNGVKEAHGPIEVAPGEQGSGHEAQPSHHGCDSQNDERRDAERRVKNDPRRVQEEVGDEQDRLDRKDQAPEASPPEARETFRSGLLDHRCWRGLGIEGRGRVTHKEVE